MAALVHVFDDGWRLAVVVTRGRKYLTLLTVGDLRVIQIPLAEARHLRQADQARRRRVAAQLRRRARAYGQAGRSVPRQVVKRALAALQRFNE